MKPDTASIPACPGLDPGPHGPRRALSETGRPRVKPGAARRVAENGGARV